VTPIRFTEWATVGDLEHDTRLEAAADALHARPSRDWEGAPDSPAGGFLAALALRAAGCATRLPRPVSFACQFVRQPSFDPVLVRVSTLHASERTAALRVSMTQSEAPTLEALVWAAANDMPGYAVEFAPIPEFPGPEGLPSIFAAAPAGGAQVPRCWQHAEFRCLPPPALRECARPDPVLRAWHRFVPTAVQEESWVDAGRVLFLVHARALSPLCSQHGGPVWALPPVGSGIDLAVQLHRDTRRSEWLMVEGRVPAAVDGIVHSQLGVWAPDGSLVASATSSLLCRRGALGEAQAA
jgi:acyl-CoA thioesterase